MEITQIKLAQFRNYESLSLRPHPAFTVLAGANAQGKTNLLEAIGLCASGRSHRPARDAQLIRHGEEGAFVRIDLERSGSARRIEMRLRRQKGRQIKLDGAPIARMGELMGCLNAVFFSPEDLRLVKDGPSERRRFIDMELSQIQPLYFYALSSYQHALNQRNALLKEIACGRSKPDELAPWDDLLAQHGGDVIVARRGFLETLSGLSKGVHRAIAGRQEELTVRYVGSSDAETVESARAHLLEALARQRSDDIRRGQTNTGPHRDDVSLRLNGMDIRLYASQGQQRTAALAMKIGEIELLKRVGGEAPVLLLDDVMSELDADRQALLLDAARGAQTFLACTKAPERVHGDVYRVQEGRLTRQE